MAFKNELIISLVSSAKSEYFYNPDESEKSDLATELTNSTLNDTSFNHEYLNKYEDVNHLKYILLLYRFLIYLI